MSLNTMDEYWGPEHVKEYLQELGLSFPSMTWSLGFGRGTTGWGARGDFYDYRGKDGLGRVYEVHRRSIHPAMRVCKEWGSLLLNEDVKVVCDDQKATEWIDSFFSSTNFMARAQVTVVRAFGLGTGAWALWVDPDRKKVSVRHYDARMVIPLTWDEDGVSFSAASSSSSKSSPEQSDGLLDMESDGTYRIVTVCFDHEGNELSPVGVAPVFDTGCPFPPSAS